MRILTLANTGKLDFYGKNYYSIVMKKSAQIKKVFLFLGDIAILYLSLFLTLTLRYLEIPAKTLWESHIGPFTFVFMAWIVIFYLGNLYNLSSVVNNKNFARLTNKSVLAAILFSLAFFYADPNIGISPKTNLLIYVFIFYMLFILWRRSFNWLLQSYLPKENIAIIGLDDQTKKLIKEIENKAHLGYSISFIINDKDEKMENEINGIPVANGMDGLAERISEENIMTIVLNANPHESPELRSMLFNCLPLKISYVSFPNFYENITGRVPIETINQMWFLENLSEGNKNIFDFIKRIYDLALASLILMITLPLWPIIGIIIRSESKGPVFFRQTRAGQNNKPFKILKFRTMTIADNDFAPTKENDARVTRFGSFLRKSRIDEIPQAINILKGEMSFVGPRPERPEYIEGLKTAIPFYKERMLVKPGLTGWDQISGEYHSPSREDSMKKLQYDLYYIKNRSIYLDLSIILKTISTVLSRSGR